MQKNDFYQPAGWVDIRRILALGYPFNFLIGGRGIGKTYTSLLTAVEDEHTIMFTRRTQKQIKRINKPQFSPWKKICSDTGMDIRTEIIDDDSAGFYRYDPDGNKQCIGYTGALSTFANLRGFDASDVDLWVFDEFIPQSTEPLIKDEADGIFNAYETMARNRELNGEEPLQCLFLANANDPAAPVFFALGLVSRVERMNRTGQGCYFDKRRGIALFLFQDSPISSQKEDTALYRLTAGTSYSDMALGNHFQGIDDRYTRSRPLGEFRPLCCVGELCIYEHKSDNTYHCSLHRSGSPEAFPASKDGTLAFLAKYRWIRNMYYAGQVTFENYLCQRLLTDLIK